MNYELMNCAVMDSAGEQLLSFLVDAEDTILRIRDTVARATDENSTSEEQF